MATAANLAVDMNSRTTQQAGVDMDGRMADNETNIINFEIIQIFQSYYVKLEYIPGLRAVTE